MAAFAARLGRRIKLTYLVMFIGATVSEGRYKVGDGTVSPSPRRQGLVRRLVSFPDPVNEVSARLVAGGVAVMALVTIVAGVAWLSAVIAYGFWARVLTGPSLSPLGQLATRVLTPRIPATARLVPGPPKRFAQGIGTVLSTVATVLALGFDLRGAAFVLLGLLAAAATLESVFGYCLGCKIFALLMRVGLLAPDRCESCNDIWARRAVTVAASPIGPQPVLTTEAPPPQTDSGRLGLDPAASILER